MYSAALHPSAWQLARKMLRCSDGRQQNMGNMLIYLRACESPARVRKWVMEGDVLLGVEKLKECCQCMQMQNPACLCSVTRQLCLHTVF